MCMRRILQAHRSRPLPKPHCLRWSLSCECWSLGALEAYSQTLI